MKKSIVLLIAVLLIGMGTYFLFAVNQPANGGGMMGGGGMVGGGMMGGGVMEGNAMVNPGISWVAPPDEAMRKNPVPADRNSIETGRTLFSQYCASCHGTNAKGSSVAPNLTNSDVQNQSDGALFWKITQGKSPMPSFSSILTVPQRWYIINFIRSLSSQTPENISTTSPSGYGYGMVGPMKYSVSMVAGPDNGVIVLMGNELLKYDNDLNLVKRVEIDFDWNAWQQKIIQNSVNNLSTTQ